MHNKPKMRHFSRDTAIEAGIRTSILPSDRAFQDATATNVGFMVQQENCELLPGTGWDYWHTWSIAMKGYKLLRRDRQGKRGSGVALCVGECISCLELNDGDDRVESLWLRIRPKANKAGILVGVCCRPPSQNGEAEEIFYKQLG